MSNEWSVLVSHYENCFEQHGASPKGADWPNGPDLQARFAVLLSILDGAPLGTRPVLLDVGCGCGLLLDYLQAAGRLDQVDYRGIDLSPSLVREAKARWPQHDFSVRDLSADPLPDNSVDFIVMNGVLTEKVSLPQETMVRMAEALIVAAFRVARIGIAFNVMSKHVDWERDDLFHWSFDELGAFLTARVSRHYAFRADYGTYEYMALVWRRSQRPVTLNGLSW